MREDIDMQRMLRRKLTALIPAMLLLALPCLAHAGAEGNLTVTPANIAMGAQYNGQDVTVTGSVPADSEVVVRFVGAPGELHLREKGKVFGLLWMNVGQTTLSNVPKVCLIQSSSPLETLDKAAAPFRLAALAKGVGVEQSGGDPSIDVPQQLLLLKTKEKLYGESAQGVTLEPNHGGERAFTAVIKAPSALAPGEYQVEVIALRDHAVVSRAVAVVKAELVGFPKWLSNLAYQNSLLYGVLATVIAIFSGLVIGLVFQSKGAH